MAEELASGKVLLDFPAEAVARIRIDNPERRNALDHEILDAIAEAMPSLDRGIETRCVLITGAPPVFSAGYDIATIPSDTFERDAEALVAHPFPAALEAIVAHPWPTLAAINGHCLGGALELAISCDLRICAAGAKLGMPPAKIGLVYGHTGLRKFLDTVGLARTKELFLTGRNLDAAAGRADRPRQRGRRRRGARARRGPRWRPRSPPTRRSRCAATRARSTRSTQNPVLNDAQEAGLIALRESCFASQDFREGIAAFAEKRKPVWRGR